MNAIRVRAHSTTVWRHADAAPFCSNLADELWTLTSRHVIVLENSFFSIFFVCSSELNLKQNMQLGTFASRRKPPKKKGKWELKESHKHNRWKRPDRSTLQGYVSSAWKELLFTWRNAVPRSEWSWEMSICGHVSALNHHVQSSFKCSSIYWLEY